MKSFTILQINAVLQGELVGNTDIKIYSPEQLDSASNDQISIIGHKKYEKLWANSKAAAAIVNRDVSIEPGKNRAFIKVDNADLAMSLVLEMFAPPLPYFETSIHPSAAIDISAKIGKNCKIGAFCYIGPNVVIGENTNIYANVSIFDFCKIGKNTTIWSGTVIRERTEIGDHCILHPNASIGADGFGFRPDPEKGLVKIPQIGNVIIGNHVEIGANTCVDRGKFSSTIIGDGCKIDNLVQIAHNCKLGKFCIMAGNSGLAGSVTLGNGVIIGGGASIKDHVTIGNGAIVGAGSGVISNVSANKTVLGYPAVEARDALKQWAVLKNLIRDKQK